MTAAAPASIEDIFEDMTLIDDWEERYRYIIELGKTLTPLSEAEHDDTHKVRGCASQVWLVTEAETGADPIMRFRGDSDALIVKGLVALVLATYSGKPASRIGATDAIALFEQIGLKEHLSPQRSNGLRSMVARIRADAARALGTA